MPRQVLKSLGLNENEIKVYLTCLSLGQALVSTIARKCGLKRTSAYPIIEKLAKKGFLACFTKSHANYYSAIDPEILLDKCKNNLHQAKEDLDKMEKLLPVLNNLRGDLRSKTKLHFYEGLEGLKAMYEDVINDNQVLYGIIAGYLACPKVRKYLDEYYIPKRAEQSDRKSKIIVLNTNEAKKYISNYRHERMFLDPTELNLEVTYHIYGNKVGFYSIKDENNLQGVLIESEAIAKTMLSIFLTLWNTLKVVQKDL